MQQTTNYKFNKPELTDLPDITQLNRNFDTIDATLKNLETVKAPLESPIFTGTVTGAFKGNLDGNASSATKLSVSAGDSNTPVYFDGGNPKACTGLDLNTASADKLSSAKTIAISGAVTGAATGFDGSKNITISTTAVDGSKVTGTVPAATKATQDSSGDNIAQTYLKRSGGTMTGTITASVNTALQGNANDSHLIIQAGKDSVANGARLVLFGKDEAERPGQAWFVAHDGTNEKALVLKSDETMTWAGKNVVRTINGGEANAAGNIDITTLPVGAVIAYAKGAPPAGFVLCNGAAVSRTTYAALFAEIGTTYGVGNSSTTFNLPNLTNRFIQGHNTVGTVKESGLPNIIGAFRIRSTTNASTNIHSSNGAFYADTSGTAMYTNSVGEGVTANITARFSANRSNSIYGASTTVQPPAVTMRYYIKY